jgi:Holliday junction resolvasome RuvABC endonuclease subunit
LEKRGFSVRLEKANYAHPVARLAALCASLRRELMECTRPARAGICLVEGYSFASKNQREAMGELGGAARLMLAELGWTTIIVPPTTLKKFVTGSGSAPKEQMILHVYKRWAYEAPDNNAADAFALMQLGITYCCWRGGETSSKATAELCRKLVPWEPLAA